jgi:lipoprotein-anchoring transpeptidase ErfK/SrfK
LHVNLKSGGRTVYYTDPADIANWVVFTPKGDQLDVSFDEAKIKDFLSTTVANSLSQKPVNGLAIAGSDGTILKQVSAGSGGQTVGDVAHLSGQIVDSLENNTSLDAEITLTAKDATMDKFVAADNHWIEVNLSTQYITLYDGTNPVGTYIASSGIPPMDTPVGLFKIWLKVTSQTMKGGGDAPGFPAYSLPGVKWVSYFNGDVGFHTKYWNDIWGRPSSHGCINLHEADAKTVFDFVQIGTPVWVHY